MLGRNWFDWMAHGDRVMIFSQFVKHTFDKGFVMSCHSTIKAGFYLSRFT